MNFWQNILSKLQDGQKVYVLTVIENFGSSPGRKGFKMLVAQDGFIYGSIGGGVMEFSLVEEAQQLILEETPPTFIKKQIHKGHVQDGSGMICSGEQTVAFHCLGGENIPLIKLITECIKNGKKGTLHLNPESFNFSTKVLTDQFHVQINSEEDWFYEEYIGYRETLYIVGGGHVGVAVAELFVKLGFYVIVFDNRKNLNTFEGNNFAHKKLVIDYREVGDYIKEGNESYVAIMTNKYTDDQLVLTKLIKNNYAFLGVLGSTAKLDIMWQVMLKDGFTKDELDRVYAPIGIPIKSETPEEIAVSIAAQVIQVKNLNRK